MKRTAVIFLLMTAGLALAQSGGEEASWSPLLPTRGSYPHMGDIEGAPRLRPSSFVDGIYETGTLSPNSSTVSSEGTEFGIGASGYRRWDSTTLGLDYLSTFRYYTHNAFSPGNNGGDHSLTLGISQDLAPNWKLNLGESGGLFHRQYLFNPFGVLDQSFSGAPTSNVFDTRTYYFASAAGVTYQKTSRLAFEINGHGDVIRRTTGGLTGQNSYQGDIGLSYGLSTRDVMRLDYTYSHYDYTNVSGDAALQGAAVGLAHRLTKNWEVKLRGGGYRVDRLTLVPTTPSVLGSLGTGATLPAGSSLRYLPDVEATLYRHFRHATAMAGYLRGIYPGDGVYLLARWEGVQFGYSDSGFGRLHWGFNGGYGRYAELSAPVALNMWRAGGGLTYRIIHALHFMARFDVNTYDIAQSMFNNDRYRVSVGLAFAPREIALQ